MTNEQVIEAVNRLTETYNALRDTFNTDFAEVKKQANLLQPLYKNGQIIWDGREDFQMTDEPLQDIISVGAGSISRYGKWNAQYMIKVDGKTKITNCETQLPTDYIVIRVKLPTNKNGTFFFKEANADNYGHGIKTAWMCDVAKKPRILLGTQGADKYADYGRSVIFNSKNQFAWDSRYYQWLGFNYNINDMIVDDKGYSYIAVSSSVSTWYIGGWAVAERTGFFNWTSSCIFYGDFYNQKTKAIFTDLHKGLTRARFDANKKHTGIRIPFEYPDNLIIGILTPTDHHIVNPVFSGSKTKNLYRFDRIPCGTFVKIRQPIDGWQWGFVHVPEDEVYNNLVEIHRQPFLEIDIDVPENERHFYFAGMFTETVV